jgi:hypothetical protein
MFAISVVTQVRNGANTLFWSHRWLHGQALADLAPAVVACVQKKCINSCTVAQALNDRAWVRDIQGSLSLGDQNQFQQLWDALEEVHSDEVDLHSWKHEPRGSFSSKFQVRKKSFLLWINHIRAKAAAMKSWAPSKCKTFLS